MFTRIVLASSLLMLGLPAIFSRGAPAQSGGRTLVGEWILQFSPIDGQLTSAKGNTLGFSDRDITFQQQGNLNTAIVTREDLTPDIHPLGVWRLEGDQFSTTFELWCPNPDGPCGTITLRGSFTAENRVSGIGTVFFEVADDTRPTGLDTWTMSFTGRRVAGGQ